MLYLIGVRQFGKNKLVTFNYPKPNTPLKMNCKKLVLTAMS